jgi:hypothetical protein
MGISFQLKSTPMTINDQTTLDSDKCHSANLLLPQFVFPEPSQATLVGRIPQLLGALALVGLDRDPASTFVSLAPYMPIKQAVNTS